MPESLLKPGMIITKELAERHSFHGNWELISPDPDVVSFVWNQLGHEFNGKKTESWLCKSLDSLDSFSHWNLALEAVLEANKSFSVIAERLTQLEEDYYEELI